jgi:DNA mismatch endonuclease, patch repair protein
MDVMTKEQRSFNMSRIRCKDTVPEIIVRRLAHQLGYRFRLHSSKLPGKPDLVFSSRHKVIFVHGCFWHMHSCANGQVHPKNNAEFWQAKRAGNTKRDKRSYAELRKTGWDAMVIWECETKNAESLAERIRTFLC